jgi:hypothetical protein
LVFYPVEKHTFCISASKKAYFWALGGIFVLFGEVVLGKNSHF